MFSAEDIALLCEPRRWLVVSSLCGSEAPASRDTEHRRWSLRHAHAHAHRELMIALSGNAPYTHPLGSVRCAPGTLVHFDAGEAHDDGYPPWTTGVRHLWFGIGGGGATARVLELRGGRYEQPPVAFGTAELGFDPGAALARTTSLAERDRGLARLDLLAVAQALVARAIEAARSQTRSEATHRARAVATVRAHVRETAGAGVSLDSLSLLAGYSRFHLVRLFREQTGMGLREWIDRCRFERLQELRREDVPLAEAAKRVGFSSASALSRWCRRHGLRWREA